MSLPDPRPPHRLVRGAPGGDPDRARHVRRPAAGRRPAGSRRPRRGGRAPRRSATGYAADGEVELRRRGRRGAAPDRAARLRCSTARGRVLVAFGAASPTRPLVPARRPRRRAPGRAAGRRRPSGRRGDRFRAGVVRCGGSAGATCWWSRSRCGRPRPRCAGCSRCCSSPGPAALAATALVGWWLARKALLPVERMASAASAIEIDHLQERVAVPRAADELRPPRPDAQRDARPPRARRHREAPPRRGRLARAPHAARGHAHGARRQPARRRPLRTPPGRCWRAPATRSTG